MNMHRLAGMVLAVSLIATPSAVAWNGTGHQVVAGIAWDNMTPAARKNAITILKRAPVDACLLDLLSQDTSRPLPEREREFFILASTWADIVRPDEDDIRPCVRFHERNWHFINFFWEGVSGASGAEAPQDRDDFDLAEVNAVERLEMFRPIVACSTAACNVPAEERATTLAWILHLVGDIHQPLHTSARVTLPREPDGDQGGNLFKLSRSRNPPSLHSFWDGILNRSVQRQQNEDNRQYVDRLIRTITQEHPLASFSTRLQSGDFEAWTIEGLETAKAVAYPRTLRRRQMPSDDYRRATFTASKAAIAAAGYRLADLLNRMIG